MDDNTARPAGLSRDESLSIMAAFGIILGGLALGVAVLAYAKANGWELPRLVVALARPVPAAPLGL